MTTLNGVPIQGLTGGTIAFTTPADGTTGSSLAGYVSPNLQGLDFSHKGEITRIHNQSGQTATLMNTDEWIEITFDFIPQGTSSANAKLSAQLPPPLSKAAVSGLPIIPIGNFADGLNTNGTSTEPWIYEPDSGSGTGKNKEHWDGKITLRRYKGITASATYAIVS